MPERSDHHKLSIFNFQSSINMGVATSTNRQSSIVNFQSTWHIDAQNLLFSALDPRFSFTIHDSLDDFVSSTIFNFQ